MIAEVLSRSVEADDRVIAAEGQQHHTGAVPAKPGITLERARQNLRTQERAGAMTDQHDLVGVAFAHDFAEIFGEAIDPSVPFGTLPVRELPGPDRVAEEIKHIGA